MKILVTDATSAIGAALVRALLDDPAIEHVLAVDCGDAPRPAAHPRLTFRDDNLTRTRAVHDLVHGVVRAMGIGVVVHGALHESARDRGPVVHAENVESTRQLLLACEGHPTIRRFVLRSVGDVYAIRATEPNLLDEDTPIELDPGAPQWVRDRIEADLTACARIGTSSASITVLRCAEVLAPGTGSQLHDYLRSRVCLRPLGFDPMVNVLSIEDCVHALHLAAARGVRGVFNVPGADTLPLSSVIARSGRLDVPVPGPLLAPLYMLRRWAAGFEFRYDINLRRFHFGGVLDGTRAAAALGYRPTHPIAWPLRSPSPATPSVQPT